MDGLNTGIKKISFYDPATGTVVQLNKISTETVVEIREPFTVEDGSGSNLYAGDQSQVEVTAFDDGALTQLEAWMNAETELNMVAYGVEAHILWYEDAPITVKQNIGSAVGGRNSITVVIAAKGGEQNIHIGSNLLFLANGWEDLDSSAVADGYTRTATGTVGGGFSSHIQEIIDYGSGLTNIEFFTEIIYPISGVDIKAYNSFQTNELSSGKIKIIEKNYAGSTLQTNEDSDTEAVLEATTDSGIYSIEVRPVSEGVLAAAGAVKLYQPYMGLKDSGIIQY